MIPLMEMLAQGGNGEAIRQMSRQFGLSYDQTEKATEALMPAFSEALKRNTANSMQFMNFMQAMATGRHAEYFDNPDMAFSGSGINEGNAILGHLFGSKELSRAVADNAAQMTGLSQSILKQMLPSLAPMILGGLFKQMSGAGSQQAGTSGNPFGWMLEQMSAGMGQSPSGQPSGLDNPIGKMFEDMMSSGKQAMPSSGADNPWGKMFEEMMKGMGQGTGTGTGLATDNPWGRMFEEMMQGGMGGFAGTATEGKSSSSRTDGKGPMEEMFGNMFETGRQVQKDYQKGIESIFDQYLDGMNKS
ncbi:MAG: DUF937 domain-containing protein [Rhizobiaceae bacterium]